MQTNNNNSRNRKVQFENKKKASDRLYGVYQDRVNQNQRRQRYTKSQDVSAETKRGRSDILHGAWEKDDYTVDYDNNPTFFEKITAGISGFFNQRSYKMKAANRKVFVCNTVKYDDAVLKPGYDHMEEIVGGNTDE